MAGNLKVVIDKSAQFARLARGLQALTGQQVMVGIPAADAERRADPETGKRPPINNAGIGYIMEHGAPDAGIPARPHMESGIADVQPRIETALRDAALAAMKGDAAAVTRSLNAAGLIAQAGIRRKITTGPFQPLAESTLAARRRRGRSGEKPLIDTGQYRNSITYVIRKRR